MNIIIPMAGLGERFANSGFSLPKPLINVAGKPMYRHAVDCMPLAMAERIVFILRKNNFSDNLIEDIKKNYQSDYNCQIILLENETRGQAETILKSVSSLNLDLPTLVHNCDTAISPDLSICQDLLENKHADGAIVLFTSNEVRWSYAKLNQDQTKIIDVQEKRVISTHASTGTYYFKNTPQLLTDIEYLIKHDMRENNEYYLSSVYQLMIQSQQNILPLWTKEMLCFGTPQDLVISLNLLIKHTGIVLKND